MMDEPDLDEMLEDHLQFGPPEPEPPMMEDYEDMMEEQMEFEIRKPQPIPDDLDEPSEPPDSPKIDDDEDEEDEEDEVDAGRAIRSVLEQRTRPQGNLFSYERYNRNTKWRSEAIDDANLMRARSWKSTESSRTPTSRDGAHLFPSAPDAQLVQLMNLPHQRATKPVHTTLPRRPKPGQKTYAWTMGDGTRVFLHQRRPPAPDEAPAPTSTRTHSPLGISIGELKRRVEASRRRQARQQNMDDVALHTRFVRNPEDSLWVDKHAPNTFAHLLSDERTNREVVRALRAWDPYVFGRDPPPRPTIHDPMIQESNTMKQKKSVSKTSDKRPDDSSRALLLFGAPGVGKTTLAHIAARHCGYRPLEINGSDDRTAQVLKDRIRRATESNTLTNLTQPSSASTPNCLILDEIDGADASAINALVQLIKAEKPSKGEKGNSKKGDKVSYLRRPLILICNNKFAPALRPLLPHTVQFSVVPPSPNRLVQRLQAVLALERLTLVSGSGVLHQLVAISSGDIRSCLFTLQFVSMHARGVAFKASTDGRIDGHQRLVDISKSLKTSLSGEGLKDGKNDVAGSITSIFKKEKERAIPGVKSMSRRLTSSADSVFDLVQGSGESSRVLDSVFLNVPQVSFIDPTMDKCMAAMESVSSSDLFQSAAFTISNQSGGFAVQSNYVACGAVAAHILCRAEQKQDLLFTTRELADVRYQNETNQALARRFVEGLSVHSRSLRCLSRVATETSPFVLSILSAGEGSISLDRVASSINLLGPQEQQAFLAHVAALCSLGLSYVAADPNDQKRQDFRARERTPHSNMQIQPPIDRFVEFKHTVFTGRREIPSLMKELLAQKAAHEQLMGHRSPTTPASSLTPKPAVSKPETEVQTAAADKGDVSAKSEAPLSTAKKATEFQSKAASGDKRKRTNNSGNFLAMHAKKSKAARSAKKLAKIGLAGASKNELSHTGSGVPLKQVMRLKYVKGFTQAVCVPCRYEDLW